jgi:hypothetical protein
LRSDTYGVRVDKDEKLETNLGHLTLALMREQLKMRMLLCSPLEPVQLLGSLSGHSGFSDSRWHH